MVDCIPSKISLKHSSKCRYLQRTIQKSLKYLFYNFTFILSLLKRIFFAVLFCKSMLDLLKRVYCSVSSSVEKEKCHIWFIDPFLNFLPLVMIARQWETNCVHDRTCKRCCKNVCGFVPVEINKSKESYAMKFIPLRVRFLRYRYASWLFDYF